MAADLKKGMRMALIYAYLVHNRTRSYSSSQIVEYLSKLEPEAPIKRNVERDLQALAELGRVIHVTCIRDGSRKLYSISPDMRGRLSLPVEKNALLVFLMMKRLQTGLPPDSKAFAQIDAIVAGGLRAEGVKGDPFLDLDQRLEGSTLAMGPDSAKPSPEVLETMLTALVERRKVRTIYRRADWTEREIMVCPARMVLWRGELYFASIQPEGKYGGSPYLIKASRIKTANLLEDTFPLTLATQEAIAKKLTRKVGLWDEPEAEPLNVDIQFPGNFEFLRESKLHPTQTIRRQGDHLVLSVTVPITTDLVKWVLEWRQNAVVLKPAALKKQLREYGQWLAETY